MAVHIPIWGELPLPPLAQSFSFTNNTTIMPQQMQSIVMQKTKTQLAHDALHGIIHQTVPPFSRPPPVQSFMNEAEFKRFISRKLPDTKIPNAKCQDADDAIMNDELSNPILGQIIMKSGGCNRRSSSLSRRSIPQFSNTHHGQ